MAAVFQPARDVPSALTVSKSETRDNPLVAAKDRADVATLSRLG